ncbi:MULTISPECIES: glycosyltransferase [unclassified Leptolyngbya]|uniref:glycosyltransferase n=1 Tax=unclassified Leptolyngbya TaxID=2650499 RepID=UPI001687DE26|nr:MULTISPECIES: glycosyltransferase [unclassified Leptolyngbya]MBD1909213.1 glycosyltransferase [Leptolyngbya sp. FACHB-8]MBD2153984.1 glycosyltransferase [Leptolyngbya sp. FACHB-16]
MHVLAYTDSAGIGGAEISLGHLVTNASSDITITVVGVNSTVVNAIARHRPQTQRYVLPATGLAALRSHLTTFHRLLPDIVHLNLCTPWACATGLLAALSLPQARVVRVDQLPLRTTDLWTWLRTRSLSLRVDAHVAVGQECGRKMEDFYALGRRTVLSVPNGVPELDPTSCISDKATSTEHNWFHIGSIGRLDPMKGHDVLLRAVAQVEGTKLVIVGDGAYRGELERLAEALGISDRVLLPGWVDQPRQYLPTFDVFVQPSRSEGFPLTVVEAMLAARPIIATRVGSVAEAIIPEKTGLLIDKDDVDGLVAALMYLRDRPDLRHQLGQNARAVALQHFTIQSMTAQYQELWRSLLTQPQVPRLRVPQPKE